MVEVSRLAVIPEPCRGTVEACTCPWDRAVDCERGCVADDVEVVLDRGAAAAQLCAPGPEAGALVRPMTQAADCEETSLYRCAGGLVVSCSERAAVAACLHGCAREGSDIGVEQTVSREAAFAILCSR